MTQKNSNTTPSMQQYLDIKKDYQDYLVFYRMGDFYELFYEDAEVASQALGLVLTSRSKDINVPMCGVPFHAYENYLARLINQGFKVAIVEQTETPEDAKKRGYNALVNREVVRLVTPGTITEDYLLNARKNNYLLCMVKNLLSLGFAWIDLSTGDFFTEQIVTSEASLASDVYNMFAKIDPSEIVLSDDLYANKTLFMLLGKFKDKITVLPANRFYTENARRHLKEFYQIDSLEAFGKFSNAEVCAAGIALEYIETTQKANMPHIKNLVPLNNAQTMEIDAATYSNLELFVGSDGTKNGALLTTIDKTITPAGARAFRERLVYPLLNIFEINRRLDCVEFFINMPAMRKDLRATLKNVADITRIVTRVSARTVKPRDLLKLKNSLMCIPHVKNIITSYGRYGKLISELPESITDIIGRFKNFSVLTDLLDRALKHNDCEEERLPATIKEGGFIRDGFDPRLDKLRLFRADNVELTNQLAVKYAEELSLNSVKIKYNTLIGYFLEIPKKDSDSAALNDKFVHRQTVLNAVRFTTSELADLEQKINTAAERAIAVEQEIYEDLIVNILRESKNIAISDRALVELDIACAMAEIATENNYTRPVLDDTLTFDVVAGRHPVVEKSLNNAHEGPFVSNSCYLEGNQNRLWLMTGPNMAGKSTFLRQNAIIAIMAQAGMYVPAEKAHIGIIDKLFSRIGASDDLAHGRSTFMVEMVETATILNQSTPKSFVILDEIGRGTATFDGLSIAWAVVEHLVEVNKCRALFATHYHELTVLANKLQALSLHAMKIKEYDGNIVFMHEVIDGIADRSYGVHVAKLAGLPMLVVKRAEQILKVFEENAQNKKLAAIENDLPLFAAFKQEQEKTKEETPLCKALKSLNPDNLTPREALDKLYEIKMLSDKQAI